MVFKLFLYFEQSMFAKEVLHQKNYYGVSYKRFHFQKTKPFETALHEGEQVIS